MKRVDIRAILRDPKQRRELMVRTIIATQAREGIVTTRDQAEWAWDKVEGEKSLRPVGKTDAKRIREQMLAKAGEKR